MTSPATGQSKEGTLRRCDLLDPLSDAQIGALADRASARALNEGDPLFRQGEESRHLFVVEGGELSVRLLSPKGDEIGWFVSEPYCLLGWSAFITPPAYVADARATRDGTTVLVIAADDAEEIMLRDPGAAYEVMKRIAGEISLRLRDLREQFIEIMSQR